MIFFAAVAIFSFLSNLSFPGFTAAPPAILKLISSAPICATWSAGPFSGLEALIAP